MPFGRGAWYARIASILIARGHPWRRALRVLAFLLCLPEVFARARYGEARIVIALRLLPWYSVRPTVLTRS